MSAVVKIKIEVHTGFAGCTHVDYHEIDRTEWDEMSECERDEYLNDLAVAEMGNRVESCAYVVEDE